MDLTTLALGINLNNTRIVIFNCFPIVRHAQLDIERSAHTLRDREILMGLDVNL